MSIQLTKLCHDLVQSAYKDLHALLDSIGDDDIPTRHQRLVDHLLIQRHRFARLLVAVRWFMSYSAFHYSAQTTRDLGARRSNVFTHGADTLWAVSTVVRGAAAHGSAVQEAAEVLGAASYLHRIPRCIESGVDADLSGDMFESSMNDSLDDPSSRTTNPNRMAIQIPNQGHDENPQPKPVAYLNELQSEAVARVRTATSDLASRALPNGVKLIKLGVEPAGAAVRVGIPDAWTADVVLDRLLLSEAFFVLLRFNIMIDSSPDAVYDIKSHHRAAERSLYLTKEQQEPLRQMLSDRMRWVALSVRGDDLVERAKRVLQCLCEAMSYECCGKLALYHIQAQCRALISYGIWSTADFNVIEPGSIRDSISPIHVRYWQRSSMADTVDISVASETSSGKKSAKIVNIVSVKSRALSHSNYGLLNPSSLDVERLLLHICRNRALDVMTDLIQDCSGILPSNANMKISRYSASVVSVMLLLSGESPELIFGISLRSGGVLARCFGTLAKLSARCSPHVEALNELLWEGERFFSKPVPSLHEVLKGIVEKAVTSYSETTHKANKLDEKGRNMFITTMPGSLQTQFKKRFSVQEGLGNSPYDLERPQHFVHKVAVERGRDHFIETHDRFYGTLSRNTCTLRSERFLFAGRTATMLALLDEALHSQAIEKLRHLLTREMQTLKVMTRAPHGTALTRGRKSQISIKTTPMETDSSVIHIRGYDGWTLRLILRRNIFDTVATGGVVSYFRKTKTLRFTYPGVSKRTVQCFRKDLIRARTAAALVTGLSAKPGHFRIRRRRPTHVSVEIGDMNVSAGFGRRSVEVETYPPRPIITAQLIPLIEEVLNDAGMEMGQRFGELLDRSLPIGQAIQSIAPNDPKKFKVRFLNALRARYVIAHLNASKQMTYAIDIDGRAGRDRMMLIDVARAYKVTHSSKPSSTVQQFSPIPTWEAVLSKLSAKGRGRPVYEGAAMQVPTSLLQAVLFVTMGRFR